MNKARELLVCAAQKLDLPPDVLSGVPRIEILGTGELAMEPHSGLLAYSNEQISVMTAVGTITVFGEGLTIKQMGKNRICIIGRFSQLKFAEENLE